MNKPISENTITLYYRPNCEKAKKARAYARCISNSVQEIDYSKSEPTPTMWKQVFALLGKTPKELIDKSLPEYQRNLRGTEFSDEDWINVIRHNPMLLRSPIAMRGKKAIVLDNPSDIYKIQ